MTSVFDSDLNLNEDGNVEPVVEPVVESVTNNLDEIVELVKAYDVNSPEKLVIPMEPNDFSYVFSKFHGLHFKPKYDHCAKTLYYP